jgi:hypothetical protein
MANNYLQFSEVIPHLTRDEEAWLRQQLEEIYVFGDCEYASDQILKDLSLADADWSGFRLWRNTEADDPDWLGFDWEFRDGDEWDDYGRHLWLYTEESGEPAHVAHLVQTFLRRFRPDQCWALTFAETCSKMRVGEFSGGGCFVTADEIRWQGGYTFVEEQRKAFMEAQKKQST